MRGGWQRLCWIRSRRLGAGDAGALNATRDHARLVPLWKMERLLGPRQRLVGVGEGVPRRVLVPMEYIEWRRKPSCHMQPVHSVQDRVVHCPARLKQI